MPRIILLLLLTLGGSASLFAENVEGHVTRVGSANDFDLDGLRVTCNAATQFLHSVDGLWIKSPRPTPIFGEHLLVSGKLTDHKSVLAAREVTDLNHVVGLKPSGIALIERVISPTVLRVDGYALVITPATKVTWEPPLTAQSQPKVAAWVVYRGERSANGAVLATSLEYRSAEVTAGEEKLRSKNEFDAASVSQSDKQGIASRFFKGVDYKRIPAIHSPAKQERLERIGQRLVPAYQAHLAPTDPNKIQFRFQLVDANWTDCVALPSGIILTPNSVADLGEDELAAVLADNIATVLLNQAYASASFHKAMSTTNVAGAVGALFVPGLGLATHVGTAVANAKAERSREDQSGRVALGLMYDAGFDIHQAPTAWWRLGAQKADYLLEPPPRRAVNLFELLSTEWQPGSPLLVPQPGAANGSGT